MSAYVEFFDYPVEGMFSRPGERAGRCEQVSSNTLVLFVPEWTLRRDDFDASKAILASCAASIKEVTVDVQSGSGNSFNPDGVRLVVVFTGDLTAQLRDIAAQTIFSLLWGRQAKRNSLKVRSILDNQFGAVENVLLNTEVPVKDPEKKLGSYGYYTKLAGPSTSPGLNGTEPQVSVGYKNPVIIKAPTIQPSTSLSQLISNLAPNMKELTSTGKAINAEELGTIIDTIVGAAAEMGMGDLTQAIGEKLDTANKMLAAAKENTTKAVAARDLAMAEIDGLDDREW